MIRALRRRFIRGAMLALVILVALMIGGSTAASWIQFDRSVEQRMDAVLSGTDTDARHKADDAPRLALFGPFSSRSGARLGYYLVSLSESGEIRNIEEKGIWEADSDAAAALTERVLALNRSSGRIDQYRFRLEEADGGARLVLMDVGAQLYMLADNFRSACGLGLLCLAGMFVILLPVSARMVRSYAANIEKQKQFITNAGHEIKTPVAVILANLDAMELICGENKWSRNMRGQVDRLSALLHRLLFMARADEGSLKPPAQPLELSALLERELVPYLEIVAEKHIQLVQEKVAPVRVRADGEYLAQLLHALLDNAVQYTPENGRIAIALEARRRRALLTLENSVDVLPDFPPEALFERFYRGDGAHSQSGGYGIGLSAARAVAEMYGGTIRARYLENAVRFTVDLPAK